MEKREEKIEKKNRGKILKNDTQQTSYKIISQSFLFESITSNDNLIYDDTGTNMDEDDDVFFSKDVPGEPDESSFIRYFFLDYFFKSYTKLKTLSRK